MDVAERPSCFCFREKERTYRALDRHRVNWIRITTLARRKLLLRPLFFIYVHLICTMMCEQWESRLKKPTKKRIYFILFRFSSLLFYCSSVASLCWGCDCCPVRVAAITQQQSTTTTTTIINWWYHVGITQSSRVASACTVQTISGSGESILKSICKFDANLDLFDLVNSAFILVHTRLH